LSGFAPIERRQTIVDLTVILTAKDVAHVPELRELLATQVVLSRKEPGCVRFEALESQTVPGTFIVVERWESDAALDAHREAEAITTVYLPHIMPLVDRVLHVCSVLPGT
jgi:quinol monooxygenase YgiN